MQASINPSSNYSIDHGYWESTNCIDILSFITGNNNNNNNKVSINGKMSTIDM